MSKKIKLEKSNKKRNVKLFDFNDGVSSLGYKQGAHIELFSNKYAYIEHCMGVYEYSDTLIKLNTGKGSVVFCGEKLEITTLEGKNLTVTGNISSVEFCI